MLFGSVCSGIEAASVAFAPLGWQAAWLAEIEPFPAAVLAHHYPSIPNLGDMTKIAARVLAGDVHAPDVLCGGTPCQAFSVAGLRQSLDDERGNLTLKFVELANAIDHVRRASGIPESIVLWENVPGVLSTKDNAFGCFLAGLAGEDEPLQPPGGKWSNAGAVYGPARAVAWRTLDAQYFGVAQRRRRVFVVASARKRFDPATVLFEWEGLRRDTAPRREPGEGVAAGTLRSTDGGSDVDHAKGGHLIPETSQCLTTGTGQRYDPETETILPHVSHTLRGDGSDSSEDGTGYGTPLVPMPFDTTQLTSPANGSNPKPGGPYHPLAAGAHAPAIAFPANLSGTQHASTMDVCPAMGAENPTAVAYTTKLHNTGSNNAGKIFEERTTCLDANSPPPALLTAMQVRRLTPTECERLQGFPDGYTRIPRWGGWRAMDVSETPEQCIADGLEVKQNKKTGAWRVKDVDGPRYTALGNSWAVPVPRWIAQRIQLQLARA